MITVASFSLGSRVSKYADTSCTRLLMIELLIIITIIIMNY